MLFDRVAFAYPTRPTARILRSLSYGVEPGKSVALVGPSGCGKSTCIQLILRYYDPLSGTVKFDEQDVASLNVDALRSQMAIVAQEPALFDRTIAQNIAYGDNSRVVPMEEIIDAAKQANIHSFIASLPAVSGKQVQILCKYARQFDLSLYLCRGTKPASGKWGHSSLVDRSRVINLINQQNLQRMFLNFSKLVSIDCKFNLYAIFERHDLPIGTFGRYVCIRRGENAQ